MDSRSKLILDCFAEWAEDCRAQYIERFDNPVHKSHIAELTKRASESYIVYRDLNIFDDYLEWDKAQQHFYEMARDYFAHRLGYGTSCYEDGASAIKRHKEKWANIREVTNAVDTISDLIEHKGLALEGQKIIAKTLSEVSYEDNFEDFQRLKAKIAEIEYAEFESSFGEKVVFEDLGRLYAKKIFSKLNPVKGRPSHGINNLDSYRAYQFLKIVKNMNFILRENALPKTTASEVCQLTFGKNNVMNEYRRSEDIKWALEIYFKVKNSTVSAFLNSISRGKDKLTLRNLEAIDFHK